MSESTLLDRIEELVAEERRLLAGKARGLRAARVEADLEHIRCQRQQLWDLIRRRRACGASGGDPDSLTPRPVEVVIGYGRAPVARGRYTGGRLGGPLSVVHAGRGTRR